LHDAGRKDVPVLLLEDLVMCVSGAPDRIGHRQGFSGTGRPDRRLSRGRRIHKSSVFQEAFDGKQRFRGRFAILLLRNGVDADLRLGVAAGKRTFRKAVERSRAKRLLREAYRLNRCRLRGCSDVVLVARRPILEASSQEVEDDLRELLCRAGLLAPKE